MKVVTASGDTRGREGAPRLEPERYAVADRQNREPFATDRISFHSSRISVNN
jgi:hypothetical protein